MSGRIDAERILDAFLAPEIGERLSDRVLDAALDDVARTPQRRALRVPWRFPLMPALTRTTGLAAVALVAVVGAGGLLLLSSRGPSTGGQPTPSSTAAATQAPTAAPTDVTASWPAYTSKVYGFQMKYPSDWKVEAPATRTWQASDGTPTDPTATDPGSPWADIFTTKVEGVDSIALVVWEVPGGGAADLETIHGLKAWVTAYCKAAPALFGDIKDCETYTQDAIPMCLNAGGDPCRGAIVVAGADKVLAFFVDWGSAMLSEAPNVRVAWVARPDDFPGAARYGGSIALLKSILTTMDVFTPKSGQVPPA